MRAKSTLFAALLAVSLTLAAAASACGGGDAPATLTVFAAASLSDALESVGERFEEEHGTAVRFSFGGSRTLAQQIVRGAPADVFFAAGDGPMDHLASARHVVGESRTDLLGNALVLVGPSGGVEIGGPEDLLGDRVTRVAMADPALAPAGEYAQGALEELGLWEDLQSKLLYGPDVRTALQYAASGAADAAVVYATDADGAAGVRVLWPFPEGSHPPVVYPVAALEEADNPDGAAAFLAFLSTEEALAVFRSHGFTTP